MCEDANSALSAAALCLFGSGELFFLLRLVAQHEARTNPARYEAGFADPNPNPSPSPNPNPNPSPNPSPNPNPNPNPSPNPNPNQSEQLQPYP